MCFDNLYVASHCLGNLQNRAKNHCRSDRETNEVHGDGRTQIVVQHMSSWHCDLDLQILLHLDPDPAENENSRQS